VNAGLRDPRLRRLVLGLALLQIATALTEGVGLVLLVPLVSALAGPTGADAGPLARAAAGLSQNLPALLALFVLLVAARSALVLARSRAALTLELALVDGLRQRAWQALLGAEWRLLQGLRRSDQASLLITNLDRVGQGVNQLLLATTTVVTLLALAMPFMTMHVMFAPATNALGQPNIGTRTSVLGSVLMPLVFIVGVTLHGARGIALAWLVAYPLLTAISAHRSLPAIGLKKRELAAAVLPPVLAGSAMGLAVVTLDGLIAHHGLWLRLALLVAAGGAVYGLWLACFARDRVSEVLGLLRRS